MKSNFTKKLRTTAILLAAGCGMAFGQTVYTFTPAGAVDNVGPTQAMVNSAYSGTNLAGNVTVTGGIQYWTVPTSGQYRIECYGGQGYGPYGGRGAKISGEFNLTAGTQLKIVVGQKAGHYFQYPSTSYNGQFGGGGGSFVTSPTNSPYVVAGGGGGNHATAYSSFCDGQITTSGSAGTNASVVGAGGTSGSGGGDANSADGGGGLLSNGGGLAGGQAFVNGALGGIDEGTGGFGCGGGTSSWNNMRGGGGGGYSGGGAANNNGPCCPTGGGGGSFNSGTNPIATAGVQLGDGQVVITSLQTFPNDAGISQFVGFAPPYCKGSKTVQVQIQNYGNNVVNNVSVGWKVNGVNQTALVVNQAIDTNNSVAGSTLTVTLGTIYITGSTTIEAWTISPNGGVDPSPGNDSTAISFQPFSVSANAPFPTLICYGDMNGIAQPTVTNATGSSTYLWSNGSTGTNLLNVGAGSYYVIATNGNCVDTSNTVVISSPPAIVASPSVTNPSCYGSSTGNCVLTVSGGTPNYSVNWPGQGTGFVISNLAAGNYNYTVTDANGCNITNTITVTQPPELVVTAVISNVTSGTNGAIDVSVTGGTPGYTYSWSNSATTQDLTGLAAGSYSITVTDLYGCSKIIQYTVTSVVGLTDEDLELGLSIFPNPTTGSFTVTVSNSNEKIDIQVFDLLGKKLVELNQVKPNTTLTLNEKEGIYLVKIKSGDQTRIQKIMLKK